MQLGRAKSTGQRMIMSPNGTPFKLPLLGVIRAPTPWGL